MRPRACSAIGGPMSFPRSCFALFASAVFFSPAPRTSLLSQVRLLHARARRELRGVAEEPRAAVRKRPARAVLSRVSAERASRTRRRGAQAAQRRVGAVVRRRRRVAPKAPVTSNETAWRAPPTLVNAVCAVTAPHRCRNAPLRLGAPRSRHASDKPAARASTATAAASIPLVAPTGKPMGHASPSSSRPRALAFPCSSLPAQALPPTRRWRSRRASSRANHAPKLVLRGDTSFTTSKGMR
jgi:hypothetical protein